MANKMYGANTITIADEPFLLVGRDASHLAPEAQEKDGARPAIDPWIWEMAEEWQASYSRPELEAPRWSHRTLCGYIWSNMKPGDGPIFFPWRTPVHAPSCRSCLRIVSGRLGSRPPDDRIPVVAALTLQDVLEYGHSRVDGVPGDQAEAVREAIRRELRRHSLRGRTYLLNETIFVVSDDAYESLPEQRKDEIQQQLMHALDPLFDSSAVTPSPGISWKTWRVP